MFEMLSNVKFSWQRSLGVVFIMITMKLGVILCDLQENNSYRSQI